MQIHELESLNRIAITGATGWLGQEAIHFLGRELGGAFERKVTLVARKKSTIAVHEKPLEVLSWSEFNLDKGFDLILHFAYLNQDKMKVLGREEYVKQNRQITSDLITVASKSSNTTVLFSSSGAAQFFTNDIYSSNSYEVYAGLKMEAEEMLTQVAQIRNLVLMRIWNLSGHYMPKSDDYALSAFITQVLEKSKITLFGNSSSLRSYCDAQEMIENYLAISEQIDRKPINSGGVIVSFNELAKLVLSHLGFEVDSLSKKGESLPRSDYFSTSAGLWHEPNLRVPYPMSIETQISNVISGKYFTGSRL